MQGLVSGAAAVWAVLPAHCHPRRTAGAARRAPHAYQRGPLRLWLAAGCAVSPRGAAREALNPCQQERKPSCKERLQWQQQQQQRCGSWPGKGFPGRVSARKGGLGQQG
jgi:hypothetical protein